MPRAHQNSTEEQALCERFLELARKGDRGADYRAALESLYPLVVRTVGNVVKNWGTLSHGPEEGIDVAHEVFLRLQESPPNREPKSSARLTVLKWIHVCAVHYLTDLSRKASFRSIRLDPERLQEVMDARRETQASDPTGPEDPERRMDEGRLLSDLEGYLRLHYPRGAEYLEALRSHPGATPKELARILGTTRQNVYQISSRLKDKAVKWRRGVSS